MNKTAVVISREWGKPQIAVTVTDKAIAVEMPLADFVEALVQETGSPAMVFTQDALRARLTAAAEVVVRKMKRETARVM